MRSLGLYKTVVGSEIHTVYSLLGRVESNMLALAKEFFLTNPNLPVYVLVSTAMVSDMKYLTRLMEGNMTMCSIVEGRLDVDASNYSLNLTESWLGNLYADVFQQSSKPALGALGIEEGTYSLHDFVGENDDVVGVDAFLQLSDVGAARIGSSDDTIVTITTYLYPKVVIHEDGRLSDVTEPDDEQVSDTH